jgi:hypothetical protein
VEAPPPSSGKSLVYIYRPSSFTLGARTAYFYVDGIKVANLLNNGYTWLYLPAGSHEFHQEWPEGAAFGITLGGVINLEQNHTYYLRLASSGAGTNHTRWEFRAQPRDSAIKQIAECRYQAPLATTLTQLEAPRSRYTAAGG